MSATSTNNTVRRTLASQLDRLDGILDTLGNGLNEAITDGVKVAVVEAVKQAVVEVLTNEELRRHLQSPTPQAPLTAPAEAAVGGNWLAGLWRGVQHVAKQVWTTAKHAVNVAWNWVTGSVQRAGELAVAGVEQVRRGACKFYAWLLSSRVAKVVGVGGLTAIAYGLGGPTLAALLSGLALALPALLSFLPTTLLFLIGDGLEPAC